MPGLFARRYSDWDVNLITHLHLVPLLSEWSYTLLPLYAIKDYQPDDVIRNGENVTSRNKNTH